jgi:hypothetical protein
MLLFMLGAILLLSGFLAGNATMQLIGLICMLVPPAYYLLSLAIEAGVALSSGRRSRSARADVRAAGKHETGGGGSSGNRVT